MICSSLLEKWHQSSRREETEQFHEKGRFCSELLSGFSRGGGRMDQTTGPNGQHIPPPTGHPEWPEQHLHCLDASNAGPLALMAARTWLHNLQCSQKNLLNQSTIESLAPHHHFFPSIFNLYPLWDAVLTFSPKEINKSIILSKLTGTALDANLYFLLSWTPLWCNCTSSSA